MDGWLLAFAPHNALAVLSRATSYGVTHCCDPFTSAVQTGSGPESTIHVLGVVENLSGDFRNIWDSSFQNL